ncbi:hypothetical protein E3N88_13404 [Mikania micrantha]|uniref:Uncharacterized protein n=1 Tax=Mikania micrantha TaxID=192012 RepID=A0A5N6P8H9_9ASTR|nr:hypothetical protein E3N88_13404 [Mikania micrantha]
MKTLMLLLFSTISLSLAQPSPDPVRDIDGNLLRSGTEYYILPVFRGMGGGVTLASTRNETCPLDVVQAALEETLGNWFKIEKLEDDYKLVFCPTVCDFCKPVCGDIGVTITENGIRRLVISEVPFKVMFKKA